MPISRTRHPIAPGKVQNGRLWACFFGFAAAQISDCTAVTPRSVAPSESICNSFREAITASMIFLQVRRTRNVNLAFETEVASCRAVMNCYRQISNSLSEIPFALGSGNLAYTFPIDRRLANISNATFCA
jgi:hypothetical protein